MEKEITPQQQKKLDRMIPLIQGDGFSLIERLVDLEGKYEEDFENIKSEIEEKFDSMRDIAKGEPGKDADSYILTEKDKREIAKSIKVPVIDKVIEKTVEKVTVEKPVNIIREVAVFDAKVLAGEGERIRDGLEMLPEGQKLAIEAIEHLREELDRAMKADVSHAVVGANRNLYQLLDVDVSGITTNQSIKWDGVKWIPYTASGGGGSAAWGGITGTLSDQTDLQSALNAKVTGNGAITGATKTKITYDSKGLVTSGADATTSDIASSADKRYVTDAQLVVIGNTSGTNTGDQNLSGYELLSNKVTSISGASTNTQYPSAKLLFDQLALKQPLDSDLTTIAGLTATTDNILQSSGSAWASRTPTQVTSTLINFVGDSGSGGSKGLVPAPVTGDATKFLKGDGTWASPSGSGDVVGPASATDNALVRFDTATGKLIQNSNATLSDAGNLSLTGSLYVGANKYAFAYDASPLAGLFFNTTSSAFQFLDTAGSSIMSVAVGGNTTFTYDVNVPDEAYGAGWDGSMEVPTKNAIYDKIQTLSGTVTSVTGTTNRITVATGTTTPVIDISASYVGQSSITTLGTITAGVWNGTAIANANLANSTISGISLGGTLAALTATDTTLTFSGSYTGALARTIGLNLANSNIWTGQQIFNTTAPQVGTATASTIAIFDASKNLISAAVATYPSLAELAYLKGVTSAIQTQINAKGAGTVTSVTSANSDATVATTTTTPVITIVSAPKLTTARNIAGNSFDGSANVAFANKFIVQGTTDAGLTGAQFLGALGTGIVKNTTTTGVLSIAVAADFPTLNQSTTGSAATLTTPRAIYGNNFDGSTALAQVIASTYGGTGNGFTKLSGPTTTEKTKTLRDANDTILELGGSYTPTGTWTSLTMVTPVLGTPTSGNLVNATGYTVANLAGLGTGVATFLATPSSANLRAAVTDETGSGALVFGTSPDFTTGITIGTISVPTISSANTFTNKRITKRLTTVSAPGATPTTDLNSFDIVELTGLNAAITSMTTNLTYTAANGDMREYIFVDNGTARAIAWGASFADGPLYALPLTTTANVVLRVLVQYQTISSVNKLVCVGIA